MQVEREKLVQLLGMLKNAASTKEIIEQSSCVVIRDGQIATFNDSACCRYRSPLDITAAIPLEPFLNILLKLPDPTLSVEQKEGEIIFHGKKKRVGLRYDRDIVLPVDSVPLPETWEPIDSNFLDAVRLTSGCVSKDNGFPILTCIHLTRNYLEASDNAQAIRYQLNLSLETDLLVKGDVLKRLLGFDVEGYQVTDHWIHFRDANGFVYSCRTFLEKFPDLDSVLNVEGTPIELPQNIDQSLDRAEVFASDTNGMVHVRLKQDRMLLRGEGAYGWFEESKKVQYSGPPLSFWIPGELLKEAVEKDTKGEISDSLLRITGENYVYVSCLSVDNG